MKFKCPFQFESHVSAFSNAADYLLHLQKCHLINTKIKQYGETRNEYYFCSSCLQVFELVTERDMHQQLCRFDNFKQLFKDVNKPIPLGKVGQVKLQELMHHYQELMNPKGKPMIDFGKMVEEFQQEIPGTTDPRLYVPKCQLQINTQAIQKSQKLILILLGGHATMEAAYFKLFHKLHIEQINREYPFKITPQSLDQLLVKNNITLTPKILQEAKVCEFCEQKIDQAPEMYLQIISTNNSKSIWLIVPEVHNPVKDYEFDEPWCIFHLVVDANPNELSQSNFEPKKEDPIISKLQKELCAEEEIGIQLQSSLQQSFADIHSAISFFQRRTTRVDKLEDELLNKQNKLMGKDSEYMLLQKKYTDLNREKFQQAEENLASFYKIQEEQEIIKYNQKAMQNLRLEKKMEHKPKLEFKILNLRQEKQCLIDSCTKVQHEILLTQNQINDKLAKASQAKKKIQMIKQLLCIDCNLREREVIQFPCQHLLFCEKCFVKNIENPNFKCPLNDLLKCKNEKINKYKLVKIGSN